MMILRHICLALLIAVLWGANFPIMKIGTEGISPLVFSALRSVFILPLLFFIPKPTVSWKSVLLIGFLIGVIKLPLLLLAIHFGVAAGLSSLLVQTQAFFSTILALLFFKQKPSLSNWIGMIIAFLGIGCIGIQIGGESSLTGLLTVLGSALFFAISNLVVQKEGQKTDMLNLIAWINIVPPLPLFILSVVCYGSDNFLNSFKMSWTNLSCLMYASFLPGLFGYTAWGVLLKKYPVAVVTPFALFVPVFALFFSYLIVDERLTTTSIYGCALIILGLIINQIKAEPLKKKFLRQLRR